MKIKKSSKVVESRVTASKITDNPVSASKTQAQKYIKCAIEELSKVAASDEVAKDSICNLGVIFFDLK